MTLVLSLCASVMLASGTASSAVSLPAPPAAPAPVAEPSLRFSPETLDLGEMVAGTPKSGRLTVTNITQAPITIAAIKGACGCTTITGAPTAAIPAGGSFTVDITVDPGTKTGVDLAKAVHFQIADRGVQTMTVKGHVKMVVRVAPEVIDASLIPEGASAVVTLESVDRGAFSLTAVEPSSLVLLPTAASATHRIEIDWAAWERAGRPAKVTFTTDKADARTLVVPIKVAPAVAMFRLPTATEGEADRLAAEAAQDAVVHAIDDSIASASRSPQFKVKLHRESGMLFVHGTDSDLALVRAAVAALPATAGVRSAAH